MRWLSATLALVCGVTLGLRVAAGDASDLRERLADALCHEDLLDVQIGAAVIDLEDGRLLFGHNANRLFNPASVTKVVTVASALEILRPEYRFPTIFRSENEIDDDGTLKGNLYIEGRGDPSLVSERFFKIARTLREIGLRKVKGRLVIDESYFDREQENVGWDCDDSSSAYRARAGAFSLNFNAVRLMIRPAPKQGQPAVVEVSPPTRYVQVRNKLLTNRRRSWYKATSVGDGNRTLVELKGHVHHGAPPRAIHVRIMDPARYAGTVMAEFLNREGIKIRRVPLIRPTPPAADRVLWVERSRSLGSLVRLLSKHSNNFQSEQLLKVLGAQSAGPPAAWDDGVDAVAGFLERLGIRRGSYRLQNGSGLGEANLFTPRQIVTVVRWAASQPEIGPEFLSAMPVAAADGTIRWRMADSEADRVLRAKTGSLESVSALAGVVLGQGKRHGRAFAIFMNGELRGRIRRMWKFQDAFAKVVAGGL